MSNKPTSTPWEIRPRRLISPLALRLMVLGLIAALIGLFPGRQLLTLEYNGDSMPSGVSIFYSRALLQANPDDRDLRIGLARKLARVGEIADARITLEPLADEQVTATQWLILELEWQWYTALAEDDPQRSVHRKTLAARMQRTQALPGLPLDAVVTLADYWLALEEPARAATLYECLAGHDSDNRYHWLSLAGQWWLRAGNPERSAQAWHAAFEAAGPDGPPDLGLLGWFIRSAHADEPTPPSRRREAALAALQAALQSQGSSAMHYARQYVGHYPRDPEILAASIQIALAHDESEQALAWSDAYLRLRPQDTEAQERHVRLALANGHTLDALSGLTQLVEVHPENSDYRHRLAQVQLWTGQPRAALASYEYLATSVGGDLYDVQIIELAQSLNDRQAILAALSRIANRHPLDTRQRRLQADLYYGEGDPERAIALIRGWIDAGPTERDLWVRMATWQEQTGQLEAALASWERIAQHFGHDLQETQVRSRLQARLWQLPEALATLQALEQRPETTSEEARNYWHSLGELSWLLADAETSRNAYQQLYRSGELDADYYPRLIDSAANTGNIEMAMQVAREDWQQHHRPETIMEMMDAAQRHQRPDLIRELFELTRHDRDAFAGSADYWWHYGDQQLALHELDSARQAYLRALTLAPGNSGLRAALLYTLAEDRRDNELRRYLTQWQTDAQGNAPLMTAVAAGYSHLGETRQALPWYDRALRADPDNYLLMLDYADTLVRVRRFDSAQRLRRYALLKLRPQLQTALEDDEPLSPESQGEHTRLLGVQAAMLGPDSVGAWLQAVVTRTAPATLDAAGSAWLFDSYMASRQPVYARYWYQRTQLQRQSTPYWQQVTVALQRNDHANLQRLLASGDLGTSERSEALRRLGHREQALTLALEHTEETTYLRQAAELSRELPNGFGAQLERSQVGDLDITSTSTSVQLSGDRLSTQLELGRRHLNNSGIRAELDGLGNERFAHLALTRRQRRGQTRISLGMLDTDASNTLQLSGEQAWQFTSRVTGSLIVDYNALSQETELLRVLGGRDQIGGTLDWRFTARNSASLTGAYTQFRSREKRNRLADGYRLEAGLAHDLVHGPTRQAQVRLLGSTEHNTLESELPHDIAHRLPAEVEMDDIVPERFSFLGAGVMFSRGEPGSGHPLVASPRYRLALDAGYIMPDSQFGMSASASLGARLFGSDELSLHLGIDQSGDSAHANAYRAMLRYQFFLGR